MGIAGHILKQESHLQLRLGSARLDTRVVRP